MPQPSNGDNFLDQTKMPSYFNSPGGHGKIGWDLCKCAIASDPFRTWNSTSGLVEGRWSLSLVGTSIWLSSSSSARKSVMSASSAENSCLEVWSHLEERCLYLASMEKTFIYHASCVSQEGNKACYGSFCDWFVFWQEAEVNHIIGLPLLIDGIEEWFWGIRNRGNVHENVMHRHP